jgi:hypothetical protein
VAWSATGQTRPRDPEKGRHALYRKIKLLGHPVHSMLVAFPIGLYTWTMVSYLIYLIGGDTFWFRLGVATNVAESSWPW